MPFMIFMTRRDERHLASMVMESRWRQALDKGFSGASLNLLIGHKEMRGSAKAIIHLVLFRRLQSFCCHPMPCHGAALPDMRRGDLNGGTDWFRRRVWMRPRNLIAISHLDYLLGPSFAFIAAIALVT